MPFGGKHQLTPAQAMVAKLPVLRRDHHVQRHGLGLQPLPHRGRPVHTAPTLAVVESVSQAWWRRASIAQDMYLTFQEYFESLRDDREPLGQARGSRCWARSMAQVDLGVRRHRRQGLHVRQLRAA